MNKLVALCGAVVAAITPLPALAQSVAGQWACQITFTEYDRYGNRTGGYVQDFGMMLYPNGTYEAQGVMTSVAGQHQFQSQGGWQPQGNGVFAQGYLYDTMSPTPGVFGVIADLMPDGTLMKTVEQPDSTMTILLGRTNTYCERRG